MKIMQLTGAVLLILALGLAGCAQTGTQRDEDAAEAERRAAEEAEAEQRGRGLDEDELRASQLDDPDSPLSERVVYFDYDSDQVPPDHRETVSAHGEFLADNPQQRLRLEGHADERGTREYNLGLGERRAQSVRQLLLLQGASADQIEIISYGEERPAARGHDEEAWRLNRRVELVYPQS